MSSYTGDVCVSTGETKEGKKVWKKVGAEFTTDKGRSIKLELMPLPKQDNNGYPVIWLNIFEPRDNNQSRPQQGPPRQTYPQSDNPPPMQPQPVPEAPQQDNRQEQDSIPF